MKKHVLSLIFIASSAIALAQTGLHFQWHLHSIDALNNTVYHKDTMISLCKVGTVSGSNNSIARLNPNTNSWTYFNSPITPSVYPTVLMKNQLQGIIYSTSNGAYTTNDGWQTSTPITLTTYTPYAASYAGYSTYNSSSPYTVSFSSDAVSWSPVLTTTAYPYFVKGSSKLFVLESDRLHVSANGGSSYSSILFGSAIASGSKLYAAGDDSLFIIGTGNFRSSTDGGNTWTSATLPSTLQVAAAACKNGKEVMIETINSSLTQRFWYYSNNSGATWTPLPVSLTFGSNGTLLASSKYFMLYPFNKSTDGSTWDQLFQTTPIKAFDVDFSGNNGIAGMDNGSVLVSNDKGYTFSVESSTAFTSEDIMAVKVLPGGSKFLAADRKSNVWESINNGQTWTKKYSNTTNLVPYKIMASQNTNTIICNRAGQPLVSVDGGNNYTYITVGGGQHCQAQKPLAGDMIDVGGMYPAPNYTLTGWEFNKVDMVSGNKTLISSVTSSVAATESILDIHMVNDNLGYFITSNSANSSTIIYKTTNAWQTVTPVSSISKFYALARIQTFGTDTILISGPSAAVSNSATYYHVSVNGGLNWTQVNTAFTVPNNLLGNKVYKINFFNANEYIALISDGYAGPTSPGSGVYRQVNGGGAVASGIHEYVRASNNSRVTLFPNPAGYEFHVKSADKFTTVKLYNVSGQEVKEQAFTASEEVVVETNDLPPGMYVVKLYAGNELKGQSKLVIVK